MQRRGASVRPAPAAAAASSERSGHGASGLTWSGVTGETPPKSSMPASSRRGNSACARFGRRLDGDVERHQQARERDRPEVVVERGLGRLGHLRAGLGAEVLHDHLLQVAVALVQVAQREQRLDALAARLADADQDAARVRDREAPGAVDRVQAHLGQLVGRAEVRPAALRQARARGLEHDPLRGADLAQGEQLVVVEDARIGVRQQARLAQHEPGAVRQVGGGRGEAEPLELLARRPVAQLGLVAEREQRLVAAGAAARLGDREHLVGLM